ncbi:SNG1 family protein [Sporobolomyces salmoneus]|uniref:SNG1 family protein n=1 Tax=Sporobolomyces salmoneus TaxID=183962 RepID=UPI003179857C
MSDTDFKLRFSDPQVKKQRKQMFKILGMSSVLLTIAVFTLLSLFWGSLFHIERYFPRLKIYVYDFDNQLLGPTIVQGLRQTLSSPMHFGLIFRDTAGKDYAEIAQEIVQEKAWGAVVINANATTNFQAAVQGTGGLLAGEWAPSGAMSIYVASSRWFQVILEFLLPFLEQMLNPMITQACRQATASFLQSTTPATLTGLSATQQAALSTPFSYQTIDYRPVHPTQWAGAAPLEAGLIYFTIFAFHIALFLNFARMPFYAAVQKKGYKLTYLSTLALRFIPIPIAYLILSLSYSLVNLAFQLPMDGNGYASFGPQAGFMVFWMLNLFTLLALGGMMEAMITLLTIKFFPIFLVMWILVNITASFFPATLMPHFYRYSYAMPFWHSTIGCKYIFWGARDRLRLNFGVLAAWTGLNIFALAAFELMWRGLGKRKERKEREKHQSEGNSSKPEQMST